MESQTESPSPQRSRSLFIAGAAILVVLNGILSALRARGPSRTTAYVVGAFFGGAVLFALIAAIVYAVARAIGKTKPASTSAKIIFWILLVLLILNAASFVARMVNPREAGAQSIVTDEEPGDEFIVCVQTYSDEPTGIAAASNGLTVVPPR